MTDVPSVSSEVFLPPAPAQFRDNDVVWPGLDGMVHLVVDDDDDEKLTACSSVSDTEFGRVLIRALLQEMQDSIRPWRVHQRIDAAAVVCRACVNAQAAVAAVKGS